jgi:hypothetical protein
MRGLVFGLAAIGVLLGASCLPALGGQLATAPASEVLFQDVKPSYRAGQPISFTVVSSTHRKIWFYCVPEGKNEEQWGELDYSIADHPTKSVVLSPLEPGHAQSLVWQPWNLPKGRRLVLRLKAEIYEAPAGKHLSSVLSPTFSVE